MDSIPQGYKASSLGVIPCDWNMVQLDEVLDRLSNGLTYDVSATNGHPVTRIETISTGKINFSKVGYISHCEDVECYKMHKGDILYSHINSLSQIGKVAYYNGEKELYHGMNLLLLRVNGKIIDKYLYYNLQMNKARIAAQRIAKPAVNQASISISDLKKVSVAIPKIEEQKKIVEILSEWDKAIELQTKLIEKLEMRKRALMQRLLTGRVRLNGYREIFGKTTLGKHVVIKKGEMLTSEQYITGPVPVIAGGKFSTGRHNVANRPSRTITISASGANAGFVSFHRCPIFATDCSTIEMSSNYVIEYIYYLLLHHQQQLYFLQSGGAQPHVQPKDIARLKVNYCSDINEQAKMSMILMVADKEIETTKAKLSLFHNQKRALMQQLLTGKQRVRLL